VAAVQDKSFFLASGAELSGDAQAKAVHRYLNDAYRYQPGRGWQRVADLPRPAVAAPSPALKVQLVNAKTRVHGGKQAVQFTVPPGKGVGAGLVKWFQPGYDQLYARWYCLETMVKANTPGQKDGEQAFWVDGERIGRFTGLRWRDTATLKLNCFRPSVYIHDSPQTNRVWMDDMVVATSYIGPMMPQEQ
jgi:hypothetical protein